MKHQQPLTFSVAPTSVGRKDYSADVAASVTPLAALPNQIRLIGMFAAPLPTLAYPQAYWFVPGNFDDATGLTPSVTFVIPPDFASWGYGYSVTGDTNATTFAGVQVYDHYDPDTNMVSDLYATLVMKFAPRVAEVSYLKGISLRPFGGKYLTFLFAHYSANPVSFISVNIEGMIDMPLWLFNSRYPQLPQIL